MRNIVAIAFLSLLGGNAIALEVPGAFKIDSIFVSSAENFHFRVTHNSPDWHCSNGPKSPAWSYINEGDSGAKGKMSALLAAYMSGKTVSLETEGVDTPNGHMCHIVEFSISN